MAAASALARRTLAASRLRDGIFAFFFVVFAYATPVGYRHSYPTLAERAAFARSFGTNKAVELFYGVPYDLLTTGGFTAWRFGGFTVILTAVWGVVASVGALRGEEESGRQELVLAGALSRRTAYAAVIAALVVAASLLWFAMFAGLVLGGLAAGGSAYLALATIAPALVFIGVGALTSQLASSRRLALRLGTAAVAIAFLLRVVADTASGLGWLRWATPLGWSEEMRPFAGAQPVVLVLPFSTTLLLVAVAGSMSMRRDVGAGVLQDDDTTEPDLRLLSSPTALAAREGRGTMLAWLTGIGLFALVVGVLSTSFTSANISANLERELRKIGGASITTPAGALGFYFLIFVFGISLYVCGQVAAVRRAEADQQLETIFAQPVDRRRWLFGQLALGGSGAAVLALAAGVLAWVGAESQQAHVPLLRLLEAGANCLPTALLFLALGMLAFALVPRASVGLSYGMVTLAYVWELFGGLMGAPQWVLDLTPFAHVGLVPAQPFRGAAAAAMLAVSAAAALGAVKAFSRRDLVAN